MEGTTNPGAGPLSGVPLLDKFRQIMNEPSRMNDPCRGTSLAQRMGAPEFSVGDMQVNIALVKHTPLGAGKTSGIYKDDRPVSFFFVPQDGFEWQVRNKIPTVWCKRFDGSTIEDFLQDVFRDTTQRTCVVADFFSAGGRAVQMWNSIRYLEASCRLCRAMSEGEIGEAEGNALFRLLFAQTGWILLEAGMKPITEGSPSFVQRSPDGSTTSAQWISGIARILTTMPGHVSKGKPQTRGVVRTTRGAYACLGGACGHGCGTPNVGGDLCIQCTIMTMAMGCTQVKWRVSEAVRQMCALPWFSKPRVYKSPEVCAFRQVASPETTSKIVGVSDWEMVQRVFSPFNSIMHPSAASSKPEAYQPFDMPMVHIECHDEKATIANTEVVVFHKAHPDETRASLWQRIIRDKEDIASSRSVRSKCASGSITVARARPSMCPTLDKPAEKASRRERKCFWSNACIMGALGSRFR